MTDKTDRSDLRRENPFARRMYRCSDGSLFSIPSNTSTSVPGGGITTLTLPPLPVISTPPLVASGRRVFVTAMAIPKAGTDGKSSSAAKASSSAVTGMQLDQPDRKKPPQQRRAPKPSVKRDLNLDDVSGEQSASLAVSSLLSLSSSGASRSTKPTVKSAHEPVLSTRPGLGSSFSIIAARSKRSRSNARATEDSGKRARSGRSSAHERAEQKDGPSSAQSDPTASAAATDVVADTHQAPPAPSPQTSSKPARSGRVRKAKSAAAATAAGGDVSSSTAGASLIGGDTAITPVKVTPGADGAISAESSAASSHPARTTGAGASGSQVMSGIAHSSAHGAASSAASAAATAVSAAFNKVRIWYFHRSSSHLCITTLHVGIFHRVYSSRSGQANTFASASCPQSGIDPSLMRSSRVPRHVV